MPNNVPASIANTPNQTCLDDLVNKARELSDLTAAGPCSDAQAGETRCLDRENTVARRQSQGFTSYRHDRMCERCAAHWLAEMSALVLEHVLFQQRMATAESQRTAA